MVEALGPSNLGVSENSTSSINMLFYNQKGNIRFWLLVSSEQPHNWASCVLYPLTKNIYLKGQANVGKRIF